MNPPQKIPNIKRREREFLTPNEMDKLIAAAKKVGRHGHRDSTMILLAYRHGLRISELVTMRWQQIDLTAGLISTYSKVILYILPTLAKMWSKAFSKFAMLK